MYERFPHTTQKMVRRVSTHYTPIFLVISYINMICLLHLMNQYWFIIIKVQNLLRNSLSASRLFFCSRILPYIHFSYLCDSFLDFPILDDLDSFEAYWSDIYKIFLNWDFSDFMFSDLLVVICFWKENSGGEVSFSSHYIKCA